MKSKLKHTLFISVMTLYAINVHAMENNTIYNMPADADFSQFYLSNELQPAKGSVTNAQQCLDACEAHQACVVWTFKPGRFGSPATCKLSPKMMQEKGEKAQFAGGASGIIESH